MTSVQILSPVRPQAFPDEWYEASDASHFWFQWRLAVLRRLLADLGAETQSPLTALDVGCGSGVIAEQLEGLTAWTVDGTDLNMQALERCRPRRGRTLYYDVSDERPELLARYDAVVLFDLLEHLAAPTALVRSAVRHLKVGGILLVNVPALSALTSAYDRAAGHQRRYTAKTLAAHQDRVGLQTRALRYRALSHVPLRVLRKAVLARGGPRTIDRGFRPPLPGLNRALVWLMHLETGLVRAPFLGTSVMYAGVKVAPRG